MNQETAPELIQRWRDGDQQAAEILVDRYHGKLLRMVANRVNQRLQVKIDPEEVVQSIMKSAFLATRKKDIGFQNETGFWKWLTSVGLNKTLKKIAAFQTEKRDAFREVDGEALGERVLKDPSPEEAVVVTDLLEAILNKLNPIQQKILLAIAEDLTHKEIAARLDISTKTVQRNGPAIRDAAIDALGRDLPTWLFAQLTPERLWLSVLAEPVEDWITAEAAERLSSHDRKSSLKTVIESKNSVELLDAVRERAKQIGSAPAKDSNVPLPTEMYVGIYVLAIASARIHHTKAISSDADSKQVSRVRLILSQGWLDTWSKSFLEQFLNELN